ncbi:ATP-dependent DNA helicase RecG [Longirhabdus pacifica]|uniref:ATP-dependent DNA helicase RecG n=1 Tax=Longirhabdus pacifica TaxID=2305227 RepID=UPI001008D38F|nr:ATP-dependent DNA helicase RecG [Longirhabdus pacifica]
MQNIYNISVEQVKGIGSQKGIILQQLGISSVGDLLDYYPYRYEDYRLRELHEVTDGEKITVQGIIYSQPSVQHFGKKKSRLYCKVYVGKRLISAVWFNQAYLKEKITPSRELILSGKWDQKRLQLTVSETEFSIENSKVAGTLQPVYSLNAKIGQKWMIKVITQALEQYQDHIPEVLPESILKKYDFLSRKEAIYALHVPSSVGEGKQARERMAYEELFLFQLKLQAYRSLNKRRADGIAHEVDNQAVVSFLDTLPFSLTSSQKEVLREIMRDMKSPYSMNRLLQGDVGSGKTIVAAIALFVAVKAGHQAALMVPTEILAEQHLQSLQRWFAPFQVEVALLTGSLTSKKRKDVIASLQMGMTHIVVGTHALIQEDVYFRSLSLVVTDEQHRFGVNQRSILRRKGMHPDVLTMTATPIPRTMAITAFGDMEVSTLKEMPKGRKQIKTYWVKHDMLERILHFIEKEVKAGRQAYIICPLIEESEKLDVQNAIDLHAMMQMTFSQLRIGLLHGQLHNDEKEEVMQQFHDNKVQVLVSTTVVEVGVDVPNATVMVIYDSDRFGLSQLHQLRGRVGRGEHQSYCILIADPKTETGVERMEVMTETNDGFEVSRRDLEIRGPGEFFGTKQSGLPEFHVADLSHDFALLEQAREDASFLVNQPQFWSDVQYTSLRDFLQRQDMFQSGLLD